MAGPRTLVLEIHNLTEHLYRALQEQVGEPLTELVEHVFDLAKARRAGDIKAIHELEKLVAGLDERQAEVILVAASLLFDLINMAEDRHRIRMLRDRERRSGDRPRPESIVRPWPTWAMRAIARNRSRDFWTSSISNRCTQLIPPRQNGGRYGPSSSVFSNVWPGWST